MCSFFMIPLLKTKDIINTDSKLTPKSCQIFRCKAPFPPNPTLHYPLIFIESPCHPAVVVVDVAGDSHRKLVHHLKSSQNFLVATVHVTLPSVCPSNLTLLL